MKRVLWAAILFALASAFAEAQTTPTAVPPLINYQGKLTDQNGNPLATAEYDLTFRVWDDAHETTTTASNLLWVETYTSVPVVRGYFNVILGSGEVLPGFEDRQNLAETFFTSATRYLSVEVGTSDLSGEIKPRQQLLSAPYAFQAERAVEAVHATVSDKAYFDPPIGSIVAWHKNLPGVPPLPYGWVECNGGTVNVPGSPVFGQPIPNLNGGNTSISGVATKGRFLRGHSESGQAEQDDSNHLHQVWMTDDASGWQWTVTLPENGTWVHGVDYYTSDDWDTQRFKLKGVETRPVSFTVVWIMRVL